MTTLQATATDSPHDLDRDELKALVRRVFQPRPDDTALALLIDLPDAAVPDEPAWQIRRRLAASWAAELAASELDLEIRLFGYRNVRTNNGDLPEKAWRLEPEELPESAEALAPDDTVAMTEIFDEHQILIAPTRFSATAPLKLAARRHGFRAATMPGFGPAMIDALRLDYEEIDRRCRRLAALLDEATGADLHFEVEERPCELHLDLRFRTGHPSGGIVREPGTAGNLPSGETYIVPYEGEVEGEPSRSAGVMPVELRGEVVFYRIEANRAVAVEPGGDVAKAEDERLQAEPAYGNLAELGLGVLGDFGLEPIGEILLDEKLGLHIAFGRSDHFGGQVGAAQFSRPEAVVHIDRVYLPQTQPRVRVRTVELVTHKSRRPLLADGAYAEDLFT